MPAEQLCFMGHATDLHKIAMTPNKNEMHLVFPADMMAVRQALKALMAGLSHLELSQDDKGTAELVLAEVLNNIVEHAYASSVSGVVELRVTRGDGQLDIVVMDEGVPLPNQELPRSEQHNLDVPVDRLPEGGFGWFLIEELTKGLNYKRCGNRNYLSFTLPLGCARSS